MFGHTMANRLQVHNASRSKAALFLGILCFIGCLAPAVGTLNAVTGASSQRSLSARKFGNTTGGCRAGASARVLVAPKKGHAAAIAEDGDRGIAPLSGASSKARLRGGSDGSPAAMKTSDPKSGPAPAGKSGSNLRAKVLFALTYASYIALYFARKPMSVCKPVLSEELGFTRAQLGSVDTAMLGAYALGQILLGEVSRFVTPRQLLTAAFLISGTATAMVGLSSSAGSMALWSGVSGFAAAPVNPLLVLFVADLFPANVRASVVGLWQTSAQVGGIAANNVAALVLGFKSFRHVFVGSGLLVASFAPVMNLAFRTRQKAPAAKQTKTVRKTPTTATAAATRRTSASKAMASSSATPPLSPPSVAEVVALPGVFPTAVSYTLVKMARYCLMLWLPTFFKEKVGMSAAAAGAMASLFDAGGVAGGLCAGLATDALAKGRMLLVSCLFCVFGAAGFGGWAALTVLLKEGVEVDVAGVVVGVVGTVGSGSAAGTATAALSPEVAAAAAAAVAAGGGGGGGGGAGGSSVALLHACAMVVCGFLVAGPDGILGGAASKNVCDYNNLKGEAGRRWAPAVAGLVNGAASVGVIAMSAGTANLVGAVGWGGLFLLLGAMMAAAALVHIPGVMVESKSFAEKARHAEVAE